MSDWGEDFDNYYNEAYYPEPDLPPICDNSKEEKENKELTSELTGMRVFQNLEDTKKYVKTQKWEGYVLLPAKWLPKIRIDNRRFHEFGPMAYYPPNK